MLGVFDENGRSWLWQPSRASPLARLQSVCQRLRSLQRGQRPASRFRRPRRAHAGAAPLRLGDVAPRRPRILVAGCGSGHQVAVELRTYAGCDVVALDCSPRTLAYARRKLRAALRCEEFERLRFVVGDILELGPDVDIARGGFELVICCGVLHHLRCAFWRVWGVWEFGASPLSVSVWRDVVDFARVCLAGAQRRSCCVCATPCGSADTCTESAGRRKEMRCSTSPGTPSVELFKSLTVLYMTECRECKSNTTTCSSPSVGHMAERQYACALKYPNKLDIAMIVLLGHLVDHFATVLGVKVHDDGVETCICSCAYRSLQGIQDVRMLLKACALWNTCSKHSTRPGGRSQGMSSTRKISLCHVVVSRARRASARRRPQVAAGHGVWRPVLRTSPLSAWWARAPVCPIRPHSRLETPFPFLSCPPLASFPARW